MGFMLEVQLALCRVRNPKECVAQGMPGPRSSSWMRANFFLNRSEHHLVEGVQKNPTGIVHLEVRVWGL